MPFPQLISIPHVPTKSTDGNATNDKPIQKPLYPIGTRIHVTTANSVNDNDNYFGIVQNYQITNTENYGYGPSILYNVLLDNGDIVKDIPDYQVCSKVEYKLQLLLLTSSKKKNQVVWKGVTHVKDDTSSDLWAKFRGWYRIQTKNEGILVFSTLMEALRAYDTEVVRWKGYDTNGDDLNLRKEWEWLVGAGSNEAETYLLDSSDDNDNTNNAENTPSPPPSPLRTKKKRKTSHDDDDDDSSYEDLGPRKKRQRKKSVPSPNSTPSENQKRCKHYKGVSYRKREANYMAFFTLDKMRFLGGYKLACDAAYVVDRVTKEFKDANKKSNFDSFEHFLEQRSREMGQVGLTLDIVGTIAALNDKIQAQIAKVGGDTSGTKRAAKKSKSTKVANSNAFVELDVAASKAELLAEKTCQPSRSHEQTYSGNELSLKERCSNYKGVSFQKSNSTFMAYIIIDKLRSLGRFRLASDAAYVADWAYESFKGKRQNFHDLESYAFAREEEMKEDGLAVNDVGGIESVAAKASAKIARIREEVQLLVGTNKTNGPKIDTKKLSQQTKKSTVINAKKMPPKSSSLTASTASLRLPLADKANQSSESIHLKQPTSKSEQTEPISVASKTSASNPGSVACISEASMKQRCTKYKGVSFKVADWRYNSFIQIKKKSKYIGTYKMACDAAFVYDSIHMKFNGCMGPNFSTFQHYQDARDQEMEDLGFNVNDVGTIESVKSRVKEYSDRIIKTVLNKANPSSESMHLKQPTSNSAQTEHISVTSKTSASNPGSVSSTAEASTRPRNKKYKGVFFKMPGYRYSANIQIENSHKYIGTYKMACDAAFVYDSIHMKFNGCMGPNFSTFRHYQDARDQEMEDLGFNVNDVGTIESVKSRVKEYSDRIIKAEFEAEPKVYLSSYKGVVLDKKSNRYRVRVKRKWFTGAFDLITDAAFAYDTVLVSLHPSEARLHFATKQHFLTARVEEMKDKGLEVADVGTFEALQSQISTFVLNNSDPTLFRIQNRGISIMTSHFDETARELASLSPVAAEAECIDLTATP